MIDVSKATLEKMERKKIHPRPRWYFQTKNLFFWLMLSLAVILSGIAFGMIVFITRDLDWDIFHYLGISLSKAVLISPPYLWIVFMLFFLFITYYNFIHTRTGYRYHFIIILFVSLLISATLGLVFYQKSWTETIDRQLKNRIPVYHHLIYDRKKQWMQPARGLLSGTIVVIDQGNNVLFLKDYSDKKWNVDISQARIKGMSPIANNLEIKMLGQQSSEDAFKAVEIRTGKGSTQKKEKGQANHKI